MRLDAVANGILKQRLEDEIRHERVESVGIDLLANGQTRAKACLLNFEIAFEKIQFLAKGHLLSVGALERVAQQFAQACDHAIGGLDVLVHKGGNGVERVEKEVRVQLNLQGLQPCFRQAPFQFQTAH